MSDIHDAPYADEPFPAAVRAAAALTAWPQRLRSQREVIRDVMLSASSCGTWLSLRELWALTKYSEASISAQLRHLRKAEFGGFSVKKRVREQRQRQKVYEYRMFSAEGIRDGVAG